MSKSKFFISALIASALFIGVPMSASADATSDAIAAAVADSARPAEDTERDANRHPTEILALAGVKAGDKVADVAPGTGYYTRLLAHVVGPQGMVYTYNADWAAKDYADGIKAFNEGFAAQKNVTPVVTPMAALVFPEKLDVFFISQFYHDGHWKKDDMAAMNKAVFEALKPGGTYLIIDHSAEDGSGDRDSGTLHRIDAALVKQEVLAAGFVLETESDILRNTADTRKLEVFDESIRGKTDQFILKFKKPAA